MHDTSVDTDHFSLLVSIRFYRIQNHETIQMHDTSVDTDHFSLLVSIRFYRIQNDETIQMHDTSVDTDHFSLLVSIRFYRIKTDEMIHMLRQHQQSSAANNRRCAHAYQQHRILTAGALECDKRCIIKLGCVLL